MQREWASWKKSHLSIYPSCGTKSKGDNSDLLCLHRLSIASVSTEFPPVGWTGTAKQNSCLLPDLLGCHWGRFVCTRMDIQIYLIPIKWHESLCLLHSFTRTWRCYFCHITTSCSHPWRRFPSPITTARHLKQGLNLPSNVLTPWRYQEARGGEGEVVVKRILYIISFI